MSKRKHDEISSSEVSNSGTTAKALRLQRLQLDGLLDQSKRSLFRSLKVARGFERQKLGRRQKTAKTEGNATDTARLEAEVAALKNLDLVSTAEIHLYKSLLKIKSIASAPAFPHHVQVTIDNSKKPQETASANVQARLFNSGPVQAAMTEALKGIRAVLGIEELGPDSKKRLRAKDYVNGSQANDTNGPAVPKREGSILSITGAQNEDEWSGFSSPESLEIEEDHGFQDNSKKDVDYDMYTSRLAGSSDEELGEEDVENQDHDRDKLDDMSITEEEDPTEAEDSSDEDDDAPEDEHPTAIKPPLKPKHARPATAPPISTTFLPSLSLGGYWSGSDSASSDNDSSAANIEVRKNRMGQQARRALWEKKFGKNANHVKKQAQDRDQGWDARKGAQGLDERGKRGRGRGGFGRGLDAAGRGGSRGGGRFAKSTGANSDPVVARKAKPSAAAAAAEGPLHPSWEAARKAKEQKKAVPFQGKKVVFD
ncbi:hypothetical protein HO133_007656 [Letharia lupina]|uniref:Bud22 domain-containing protein n=1 Tax=Letharia lupina TaxID=560253 RepID=A0A8H6FHD1_9LECA|nr:uncharacterized protein HO133_007656 [Letharia lupina]KAF6227928.1 hypothetical protein HO133_007656 [Letharia lupina]